MVRHTALSTAATRNRVRAIDDPVSLGLLFEGEPMIVFKAFWIVEGQEIEEKPIEVQASPTESRGSLTKERVGSRLLVRIKRRVCKQGSSASPPTFVLRKPVQSRLQIYNPPSNPHTPDPPAPTPCFRAPLSPTQTRY